MIKQGGYKKRVLQWRALACMIVSVCSSRAMMGQRTIHVPADEPTIQAGINAASPGDTVLVSPGVYSENIDFLGKGIVVTTGATDVSGATSTLIQGAHAGPVVTFQTNEPTSAVMNGFTITKGFGVSHQINGDGLDVLAGSPTISNNIITANVGCGVFVTGPSSSPSIDANTISSNVQPPYSQSQGVCAVPKQPGWPAGTGIAIVNAATPQVVNNTIENNDCLRSDSSGASACGISVLGSSSVLVRGNTIVGNDITYFTSFDYGTSVPTSLSFIQNVIYESGIYFEGSQTTTSPQSSLATLLILNNTSYNSTFQLFGDIGRSLIVNNIFTETSPGEGNGVFSCSISPTESFDFSKLVVKNNDIYTTVPQPQYGACPLSTGNITTDPQFINTASFSTLDLHTQRTSPVVAAGDITAPMLPPADFSGVKNRTVCGTIDMGAYEVHPQPVIQLSSSPNPSVGGTPVAFQATVQGNCNVPTGTVTLLNMGSPYGTSKLNPSAMASIITSDLLVGTDTVTASYSGDFNFDPSTLSTQQVVTGYPTSISLQISPNPATAFQLITFTAIASSVSGVPDGTVSFVSGGQVLATASLNGNGVGVAALNTLGVGSYPVTAVYNPSLNYAGSTSPVLTEVVVGAPTGTVLTSSPNPSTFGQLVSFPAKVTALQSSIVPAGSVTFREGTAILGTMALSTSGAVVLSTASLAVGTHMIVADYSGNASTNSSTSNVVTQVVQAATSSVTLTGTPNPAAVGQTVTLAASVMSVGSGSVLSGTVAFTDQSGVLGSSTLSNGQALLNISTLPSGTHNIVATYTASGNFGGSTSPVLSEVIQSFDFSITLSPANISLEDGKTGLVKVTLNGAGNLPGNITLSASQIPTYATLAFSPTTVQFAPGGIASSELSLDTVQESQHALLDGAPNRPDLHRLPFAVFALLGIPLWMSGKGRTRLWLCLLLVGPFLLGLGGCTNIYYPLNQVAPGTYTIPVTAVDSITHIAHTAALTLTVIP